MHTIPIAVFFAGTNGAGKSSLRGNNSELLVIDPDAIAKKINFDNPRNVDVKAGKMAIELFNECLRSKTSFSMETTLSGKSAINRIKEAKDAGFFVSVKFIGLINPDMNVERVRERVKKGGHHIEEMTIRKRYHKSLSNVEEILHLIDKLAIYDNSIKYHSHRLYTLVKNNHVYKMINPPLWVERINEKINASKELNNANE